MNKTMRMIKKLSVSLNKLLLNSISNGAKIKLSEQQQEHFEYVEYINEHIANVNNIWQTLWRYVDGKFGIDFWIQDCDFFDIDSRIKSHDASKLGNKEFYGYAQWFYPKEEFHKCYNAFKDAWNRHQKANDHHWQYWTMYIDGKTIALSMPYECMIEMLCDWGAMSIKYNNKPSDWYAKEKNNMLLHETTRSFVERWLPKLDSSVDIANKQP